MQAARAIATAEMDDEVPEHEQRSHADVWPVRLGTPIAQQVLQLQNPLPTHGNPTPSTPHKMVFHHSSGAHNGVLVDEAGDRPRNRKGLAQGHMRPNDSVHVLQSQTAAGHRYLRRRWVMSGTLF
jgi:hypothetical protein